MGLLDGVLTWVARAAMSLTSTGRGRKGERALASMWPGGGGFPGGWSSDRAEQVRHYRHWVYVGIRAIGNEIARAAPQVAFARPAGSAASDDAAKAMIEGYTRWHRTKAVGRQASHAEELEPAGPGHPLSRLLADPNGPDTGWDFFYELVLFLELTGNAYVWAVPNGFGLPCELWVIPSHWVFPVPGKERLIDAYDVRPYGASGGKGNLRIPESEVIHLANKNPLHKVDGFSGLRAGAEWIDTEESISRTWWAHFKEGCWPGLHVKLGGTDDPDDEELERYYAKFLTRFQGELNSGRPIITSGGTEVLPLTHSPTEMAYTIGADKTRDLILALLGVPKGVVGIEPAGDNISAYAPLRQFCRFTISPLLTRLAATFSEKLGRRFPGEPRVWYPDPTPDDPKQVNEDIRTDLLANAITDDEVRALRGRAPFTAQQRAAMKAAGDAKRSRVAG